MKKTGVIFLLLLFGLLGMSSNAAAQFDRDLDPVIVLGSECGELLGIPTTNVRVYVYNSGSDIWAPIPFQVDDFKVDSDEPEKKNVEWVGDGVLGGVDEIVFMAKDLGDQAADVYAWPDDMESKNKTRYEVVVIDPTSGESRYAYIYGSSSLALSETSYIDYNSNDIVLATSYSMGHDTDDAGGLPDFLTITGNNTDILDGWRIRAHIDKIVVVVKDLGNLELTGTDIYFSENMNDSFELKGALGINIDVQAKAFHEVSKLKVKAGPVRIIREHVLAIELKVPSILTDTSRIPITNIYYDKSVDFRPAFSLNLGDDLEKLESDFISFSSGFNQNSMNVKFYGDEFFKPTTTVQDSVIDRNPENDIFKLELDADDWPGKHWFGFTGSANSFINNASFVTIAVLNGERIAPNRAPALFHYDYVQDEDVYGISGLRIYDWDKSGSEDTFEIDAQFRKFYLTKNSTHAEMQALFDQYSVPMQTEFSMQHYPDEVAPAIITDLHITARDDTSATLSWTAVGDDGMANGPAAYYVVRYSKAAPANPDGNDWTWWGGATSVPGAPKPAEPGATETFVVTGLEEANVYYFRINVADDAGNASGLSNTASGSTTPVELVGFDALVSDHKNVLLKWSTASETNNLGFAIERSVASSKQWIEIGFVKGAGTTTSERNYTFADTPENIGDWSYRLKQVDADGVFEYSDPITVSIAAPQIFALYQNYPNPFNPGTTISFQIPEKATGVATLVIYDMLGRKVKTLINENIDSGYYDIPWDGLNDEGTQTATGIYFYSLRTGSYTATKKMIKMQ